MALTQISTQGIKDGTITGTDLATNVDLVDNQKLRLGTGNDLQIYHNSSDNNSYIKELGSGCLVLNTDCFRVKNAAHSENLIAADQNSSVQLFYDNVKKFETTSAGVSVTGSVSSSGNISLLDTSALQLGTSNDFTLTHNGTNSVIDNNTGDLIIRGDGDDVKILAEDDIFLRDNDDTTNFIHCINGGAVELYHNGSKKFETTSTGVSVTGNIQLPDDGEVRLGADSDIRMFHSGTQNLIQSYNDKLFRIQSFGTSAQIRIQTNEGENNIVCSPNAGVELYYDNSVKLATTGAGVTISGSPTINGTTIANGHIRVRDHTGTEDGQIMLGAGNDLRIYHSGTNSIIDNTTGELQIATDAVMRFQATEYKFNNAANSAKIANFFESGACELYFDHSKKFETTSAGVTIEGSQHRFKGDIRFDNNTNADKDIFFDESGNKLNFFDDVKATFGNSDDLQIYHDGSNSYAVNTGGQLLLRSTTGVQLGAPSGEAYVIGLENGAVELYYDNSKVLETTSTGVTVTGRLKQTTGCAFRARATSDGQSVPVNTPTKVNFGTEVYDYGGVYNPSNSRFTAPVDGVYNFSWSVRMGTPTSTPKLDAEIRVNGNSNINFVNCGYNQQASNNAAWIGSGDMFMSAGDYAELFVDQNTSSTTTLVSNSNANSLNPGNHLWWTGHLIHAA